MVSRNFLTLLERLDRALFVELDRERQRYVIYRKDRKNMPRKIIVIEDEDGNFAKPSYQHIAMLYKMDTWANPYFLKEMDAYNAKVTERHDRELELLSFETANNLTRGSYF